MIGFKPVKNRGKVEFYTHVESTMPSHFVLRLKVIFWTSCARSHFWIFLLPVAIIAITVAICYFGIISILSTRGSYLVLVCLTSIYQYVYVFFYLLPLIYGKICPFTSVLRTILNVLNLYLKRIFLD